MSSFTNNQADVGSPPADGVTATARDEAGQLKETSAQAAHQVAESVKDKASSVTSDAREQTRRLAAQTRDELIGQAGQQKERAVGSLRAVGDELRGMAEHGRSGLGAQLANHGADFTTQAADFLQHHEPGELLDEVRGFARRKPGTFLLLAAAAGVVAGRLTRALAAGDTGSPGSSSSYPSANGLSTSANGLSTPAQADDEYLVPPTSTPMSAPPIGETAPPPPTPTPVAPDPDPGAPVTPRFGPGQVQ
ncbi:hypothetical protein [Kribbella sp. NPDC006257]|uniref:hypothetical protein n=1 Tax=Kribbella sp. NPDC006257 TaxID=3156738 RepID=UPI0033BEC09D